MVESLPSMSKSTCSAHSIKEETGINKKERKEGN